MPEKANQTEEQEHLDVEDGEDDAFTAAVLADIAAREGKGSDDDMQEEGETEEVEEKTEEETKEEEPKEETEKEEPEEEPDDTAEAIARKDQEIAALRAGLDKANQAFKKIKEDPYAHLEELGVDYLEWTDRVLKGKSSEASGGESKAEKRIAELEAKIAAKEEKDEQEKKQAQARAQMNKFLKEIETTAKGNDDFELVNSIGAYRDVLEYAQGYYHQTKKVLPAKKALQAVEEFLEKQVNAALGTKKMGGKKKVSDTDSGEKTEEKKKTGKKPGKTLSNDSETKAQIPRQEPDFLADEEDEDDIRRAHILKQMK